MTPLPPGLDDQSARRWLLAAIDRKQQQLIRNGMVPAQGLAEFAAWLACVTPSRYSVEDRTRALTRERVRRYRQRQREKRDSAA